MRSRYRRFLESRFARTRDKSDGVILVFSALFMFVLLIFMAFAVDVGFWYVSADKLQRASDSAALSGAADMPDSRKAVIDATATLAKNGFVADGSTRFANVTPIDPNRVHVEVKDTHVPTFFGRLLFDHVSITRKSEARFRKALPLGSPHNILGSGWLDVSHEDDFQGKFWLAVNGWCTAKEDGDPVSSRYDANKRLTSTVCPSSPTAASAMGVELNDDYDPTGYDFITNIPPGAPPMTLSVYDAGFAPGTCPGERPLGCSPDRTAARPDDVPAHITTFFTLLDTRGTDGVSDDLVVPGGNFTFDSASLPPCAIAGWCGIATLPGNSSSEPHAYRLNVRTLAGEGHSYGVNAFALSVAPPATDPTAYFCDVRNSSSCPQVFASKALSIFTNFNPDNDSVRFFLADVDREAEKEVMTVSLWDPGEGTEAVKLRAADGKVAAFRWQAKPNYPDGSLAEKLTERLRTDSDDAPQPGPNRTGTGVFNDRSVEMKTVVPEGRRASDGSGWWSIEYRIRRNDTPQDRTTWRVKVSDDRPVQLVRTDS